MGRRRESAIQTTRFSPQLSWKAARSARIAAGFASYSATHPGPLPGTILCRQIHSSSFEWCAGETALPRRPTGMRLLMNHAFRALVLCAGLAAFPRVAQPAEFKFPGHTLTVPEGFEVQLVASPGLVDRPITADF